MDGAESMHPAWMIPRMTPDELSRKNFERKTNYRFNCAFEDPSFTVANIGNLGTAIITNSLFVTLPVLTNITPLKKGERLILEVAPRAETSKRPAETWRDTAKKDGNRDAKKAKGVAGANGAPGATHTSV